MDVLIQKIFCSRINNKAAKTQKKITEILKINNKKMIQIDVGALG